MALLISGDDGLALMSKLNFALLIERTNGGDSELLSIFNMWTEV